MANEKNALIELNNKINYCENEGDRDKLSNFIAPKLAFLRADGTIVNRKKFLKKVKRLDNEAPREIIDVQPFLYNNRAVVICIIKKGEKYFHNLRLFIKQDNEWKLLGWANEERTLEEITEIKA